MAKDLNDSSENNEEEFLFSQEHESPEKTYADAGHVDSASTPPNTPASAGQRKKVILIIGVIAAVFCIYKLYGLFSSTSVRALKSPIPVAKFEETNNAKPAAQTVQAVQSASKLPDFSNAASQGQEKQEKQEKEEIKAPKEASGSNISSVSNGSVMMESPEKNTANKQQVSTLEKSQENLQNQISGLSSAINEIQNNIAMLSQQVGQVVTAEKSSQKQESKDNHAVSVSTSSEKTQNTSENSQNNQPTGKQATSLTCEKSAHHKLNRTHPRRAIKYPSSKMNPSANYYVRSMIQGRAWLLWGDNNTLTVSTGDVLPGYGKIEVIDTDNGVIKTSSGREIGYRSQDR